jgi:membrane protein YqaA with SNARE-associated domain
LLGTTTTLALFGGIAEWMQSFADTPYASLALLGFAFAESSFFPIPPDVLLIALCLTDASIESLSVAAWFGAICTVGSTVGGAFGYVLGMKAGRPILARLTTAERIEAVERLLQKYDVWAIAIAGFTPVPYKVFTIASGLLRVRFWRFMIVSVLSRGARFFLVAMLCHAVGRPIRELLDKHLGWASLAFAALLVGGFFLVKWAANRYKEPNENEPGAEHTK